MYMEKNLKQYNGEKNIDKHILTKKDLFYIENTGQFGDNSVADINIEPVKDQENAGQGIKIGVIDDLIDNKHPDLVDNASSKNLVNYGKSKDYYDSHGTSVAGFIAARDNNIGIRGVGYRSELYSYFFELKNDGRLVDLKRDIIRVFNCKELRQMSVYNLNLGSATTNMIGSSYLDDGLKDAFDKVTKEGFYGKGSSLVFAAGNSSIATSSNEAFLNHHATIAVNSIDSHSIAVEVGSMEDGGTIGTNIWLISPSQIDMGSIRNMISTETEEYYLNKGKCTNFSMTSTAAPFVAGIVAILRQINSNLTWRDIKIILAESANKLKGLNGWRETGRMYNNGDVQKYHRIAGFGLVDASAASQLAKNWRLLPTMKKIELENKNIISTETADITHSTTINVSGSDIKFIESVNIDIDFETKKDINFFLRYFELSLVSPDGKQAWFYKNADDGHKFFIMYESQKKMRLSSNRFLGNANIDGDWILKLKQANRQKNEKNWITQIKVWKLTIRGH